MRRLILLVAALATFAFPAAAQAAGPVLTVSAETLHWTNVPSGSTKWEEEEVEETSKGITGPFENALTSSSREWKPPHYVPTAETGTITLKYRVRAFQPAIGEWSNQVSMVYPWEAPLPETWEGFTASNPMPASRTVFGTASFINTPVPANPKVLSNSAAMVTFIGKPQEIWTDGGGDHPWYYAKESDPIYEVTCSNPCYEPWVVGLKLHIPSVAKPSVGSDHHMGVVERNGETFDFWSVQKGGPWEGRLEVHGAGWSSSLGTGSGVSEKQGGATASGINIEAGVIRSEEWAAGHINHALFIPVHQTKANCHIAPATGTDGTSSDPNAPCQGQRFYLPMTTAEIEALPIAEAKETVLEAMHEFGMIVGDSGGTDWAVKLEGWQDRQAYGLANPYNTFLDQEPEITKETGGGGASDTLKLEGGWELSRLRAIE